MTKENATYVSVWDGDIEICTNCTLTIDNDGQWHIYDVESADGEEIEDLDTLEDEYIMRSNGEITSVEDCIIK